MRIYSVISLVMTIIIVFIFMISQLANTTIHKDDRVLEESINYTNRLYIYSIFNDEIILYDDFWNDVIIYDLNGDFIRRYDFSSLSSYVISDYDGRNLKIISLRYQEEYTINENGIVVNVTETTSVEKNMNNKCYEYEGTSYCVSSSPLKNYIVFSTNTITISKSTYLLITFLKFNFTIILVYLGYSVYKTSKKNKHNNKANLI